MPRCPLSLPFVWFPSLAAYLSTHCCGGDRGRGWRQGLKLGAEVVDGGWGRAGGRELIERVEAMELPALPLWVS